jgi:hypothetical protein
MRKRPLKKSGTRRHSLRQRLSALLLTASVFSLMACTTLKTPKSVIELSQAEMEYYQNLRPALRTAKTAFERSSLALDTSIAALEENRLIDESLAKREEVFRSMAKALSSPRVSTEEVRKAIDGLVRIDLRITEHLKALDEANEVRRKAISETFTALDRSLRVIVENKQVIHSHLEGKSASPSITSFEDVIRWLKENSEMLQEQFELAKEIVEEARGQFGDE